MSEAPPTRPIKVAVVTGSRADYGLLRATIQALAEDPRFELQLLVTAMHLNPKYGSTVQEIDADGFQIAARIETPDVSGPDDLAAALSQGVAGFADSLGKLRPDALLVLGDRHEILAAAVAATGLAIPIAHVHGGELSEGSIDDTLRHSVTKLSHLHFVATRLYGERVCQLGEQPDRVHVVGAPAVEAIRTLALLDLEALGRALGDIAIQHPLVSLTLHPTSLDPLAAGIEAAEVVAGVNHAVASSGTIVVTLPNDDVGNTETRRVLVEYAEQHANVHAFRSLGQLRYLSLLRHADAVVGNSSSALIEAPSFELPAVNVGSRQHGRLRAANVVDCDPAADAVAEALSRALSSQFRSSLAGLETPYGSGDTSTRILEVLATTPTADLRRKRFLDLPDGPWRASLSLGNGTR